MSPARWNTFWIRGLSMLLQLFPRSATLARRGRDGLVVLATIALSIPSLGGRPAQPSVYSADLEQFKAIDDQDTPPKTEDKALEEFLQIYSLDPGQKLKHVPPPRPEGIAAYWKRTRPGFANRPDQFPAMTFRWSDPDRLVAWAMTSADAGFSLRDLPRYLEIDVHPTEIEGDPELLKTTVPGDWIYRTGTPGEQLVAALEARLQRILQKRITLKFRQVERDVVVVRGEYRYSPVTGRSKNQVEIYGKQIVPNGGGAGGGSGTFPEFLKWVGNWIERPVVSEVKTPPRESLEWYYNARSPFTEQMRREDHDEALVLHHLQEQTGLTYTRERKPIRVLFIERAK